MAIRSIAHPGTRSARTHLVVGWDRTPASRAAVGRAVDLAHALGAQLHIAHVADDSDLGIDPDSPTWEAQTRALRDADAQWLRALLAGVDTGWTYYSARGNAAAVLGAVAAQSGATMVVIGARRRGWSGLLSRLARRPLVQSLLDAGLTVVVVPPATSESR